jgi:hypothetical protein
MVPGQDTGDPRTEKENLEYSNFLKSSQQNAVSGEQEVPSTGVFRLRIRYILLLLGPGRPFHLIRILI